MPFEYILPELLAEVDDAAGVLFLDADGEMIDSAVREPRRFDMQLLGAFLGLHLRRTGAVTAGLRCGTPRFLRVELGGLEVLASALADGYCLALVRGGAGSAGAARLLRRAATALERELLGGSGA